MQCVVADWKASAGHVPDVPVHVSATSHWPAEGRQVTLAALYASTHVLLLPEQRSAERRVGKERRSRRMPCDLNERKASAGHVPDVPVHVSATSHWPAEGRQ